MPRLLDNLLDLRPRCCGAPASRCTPAGCSTSSRRSATSISARATTSITRCRALLVQRHEQIAIFDRAFDAFWREHRDAVGRDGAPAHASTRAADRRRRRSRTRSRRCSPTIDDATRTSAGAERACKTWSDVGALARQGLRRVHRRRARRRRAPRCRDSSWKPGERRTRRWVRGRGRAHRSAARASPAACAPAATSSSCRGGRGASRPRPLVLLCDVSGSMERYSRMLLHFAHALTQRHRRVEAFLFSTRLTRVTTAAARAPARTRRSRRCRASVARLVGRHAHRRGAAGVPPALAPPRAARRAGRAADLRRLGPRRSGGARASRSRGCSAAVIG